MPLDINFLITSSLCTKCPYILIGFSIWLIFFSTNANARFTPKQNPALLATSICIILCLSRALKNGVYFFLIKLFLNNILLLYIIVNNTLKPFLRNQPFALFNIFTIPRSASTSTKSPFLKIFRKDIRYPIGYRMSLQLPSPHPPPPNPRLSKL